MSQVIEPAHHEIEGFFATPEGRPAGNQIVVVKIPAGFKLESSASSLQIFENSLKGAVFERGDAVRTERGNPKEVSRGP